MKSFYPFVFFLLCKASAFAQHDCTLRGVLMDTVAHELLKVLYENRDKIIDRKDILNLLWGNDSFFNSRNLDVYVTRLRSYIREDESLEIITIKGIGYRFVIS